MATEFIYSVHRPEPGCISFAPLIQVLRGSPYRHERLVHYEVFSQGSCLLRSCLPMCGLLPRVQTSLTVPRNQSYRQSRQFLPSHETSIYRPTKPVLPSHETSLTVSRNQYLPSHETSVYHLTPAKSGLFRSRIRGPLSFIGGIEFIVKRVCLDLISQGTVFADINVEFVDA